MTLLTGICTAFFSTVTVIIGTSPPPPPFRPGSIEASFYGLGKPAGNFLCLIPIETPACRCRDTAGETKPSTGATYGYRTLSLLRWIDV